MPGGPRFFAGAQNDKRGVENDRRRAVRMRVERAQNDKRDVWNGNVGVEDAWMRIEAEILRYRSE